mgnify:CR=1 FL=1
MFTDLYEKLVNKEEKIEIIKSLTSRTNGDLYLGVVGAVRTGKSTFIKKVIEAGKQLNPEFETFYAEFVQNDSSHKTVTGNNVRKRSALIPTPGCRQYDSYPVVVNKDDF